MQGSSSPDASELVEILSKFPFDGKKKSDNRRKLLSFMYNNLIESIKLISYSYPIDTDNSSSLFMPLIPPRTYQYSVSILIIE